MTCKELLTLLSRDPADCTVAERVGFFMHLKDCESCRKTFHSMVEQRFRELAAKGLAEIAAADAIQFAHEQSPKDFNDPEVQEMLKKYDKSQDNS